MLTVGLTGGIAAGKSLVSTRLRELGAVVIDADALSREVVEPGSEGLAAVVSAFGRGVLTSDGQLDRTALGAIIFKDSERRAALNAIIHPLVRGRAREMEAAAGTDAVVVHDIPLLAETGQGAAFHLVVVVEAPAELRVDRMVRSRGLSAQDAQARIAAQATDAERGERADVVIQNSGRPGHALAALDRLWEERLAPYNRNIALRRVAPRTATPVLVDHQPYWADVAARLSARLLALDDRVLAVEHVGATAVPGLPAEDVIDLQLAVADMGAAEDLADVLAAAGFPRAPADRAGALADRSLQPPEPLYANADPQRAVNLHVRTAGSGQWRQCLAFRDWLRADPDEAEVYAHLLRHWARSGSGSAGGDLADVLANWFRTYAHPRVAAWTAASEWAPPKMSG